MLATLFLLALSTSTWAQIQVSGPLLTPASTFTYTIETTTITKNTPCYILSDPLVTNCRRRRGIEEIPHIITPFSPHRPAISPSAVVKFDSTPVPRSFNPNYLSDTIFGSFDDSYYHSMNMFRQLAAKGRNNLITVGNCGSSTVNFSQFLSCLGLTVQETTTLTATFTETATVSSGYTTLTVGGCLPSDFPYVDCLVYSDENSTFPDNVTITVPSPQDFTIDIISPSSPLFDGPTETPQI